jgi:acyl transferase domain-containing protein/NAD(P)-dependent dehydrogenase (short-subunit alcohol dehydrogenase family)/NAD(P)H-dependent flavin oxidoreductase YrpB (nitropropane dioxygenase family)
MGSTLRLKSLILAPAGLPAPRLVQAAARAGSLAVLSVTAERGPEALIAEGALCAVPFGLATGLARDIERLAEDIPTGLAIVVGPVAVLAAVPGSVSALRASGIEVMAEVIRCDDAALGLEVDGFILKGHECGGVVSEQTTFVLLQDFRRKTSLPLLVRGGVTPETAAAAVVGGAAGVMLDDQIVLLAESPLTDPGQRRRIMGFSGSETLQVEHPAGGRYLRGLEPPGGKHAALFAARLREDPDAIDTIAAGFSWAAGQIAPAGQGLALAQHVAVRFRTVGRLIGAIQRAVDTLPAQAAARAALAEGAPLAQKLGTRYPILQGPMTRVSDVSDFFLRVAEGGALPFAALALLSGDQTLKLLEQTRDLLGDRPWGVGMLGFADTAILKPQMEAVDKVRPDFAIIAGGRINQVLEFEKKGIPAFVHASTAGIITHYLDEGVRRFILEGRECGGHVGPLSSFVLWGCVVEALRDHPVVQREGKKVQIVFAGGIHDAASAAMAATIGEPLAAMGVQIGVLMGTGYLFTREIVESGAIVPDYQQVALDCTETRCLWEGPGFASRCAITPIVDEFTSAKLRMEEEGASVSEVREVLETFSLGRLRMATKGLARTGPNKVLTEIGPEERHEKGMYMIGQVAALNAGLRTIAAFHDDVSAGSVAWLQGLDRAAVEKPAAPAPADIAIIGMATLLPGSDTLAAYWRRILSGQSAIRPVPADRWSEIGYFDEDRTTRDKVYSRRGGFLDDVAFNPLDYGIPPTSMEAVDPVQLLALELVSDVLKDAANGATEGVDRSRTSVVFGFSGGMGEKGTQYVARAELPRLIGQVPEAVLEKLPEWTEDSFAGLLPNVAAGRVANRFDFGGSNTVVDAACASSLAAVYQAVMELESGRSDTVVAGGIDSLQSPFGYLCFSKTQALSPRGICNTFDKKADGIVISEGMAAVVLKRLADAERDGDRIYAVIKGIGASSDGRAKGLTAPLPAGQKRALDRAYAQAGFDAAAVELFEAHGTGTVAGDKAELDTVTQALTAAHAGPKNSAIGSVKTLIGHTKAAAGLAGLIKVTLGLHHKVLPPHALVDDPNAVFEDDTAPLYLSQSPQPWVTVPGRPRRAGVSSFGFGGTNFHVAVEEYSGFQGEAGTSDPGIDLVPFAFAATARAALQDRVSRVDLSGDTGLQAAARKVLANPGTGQFRLAFVAGTRDEAQAKLTRALAFLASGATVVPEGLHYTETPRLMTGGKLAFLFPGQGSQYPDMARQTALLDPAMIGILQDAEAVLTDTPTFGGTGRRLARLIWPGDAFTPAARKAQMAELTATEVAQPALGAVEAGMLTILSGLGVRPDMTAGHSYGEFVALHAAGAFGLSDLIRLSEARGRAMVENGDPERPGGMAAVSADAEMTRAALVGIPDVVIANLNSPRQTVIAGPKAAVASASEAMAKTGLQVTPVPVSQAFHSPLMQAARAQFDLALGAVDWRATTIPVYSNTIAAPHDQTAASQRAMMSAHLVSAVDFTGMIRAMAADGASVFVEVGPKSVLSNRLAEILGPGIVRAVALDRASGDAMSLVDGLTQLFVEGASVDLAGLLDGISDVTPRSRRRGERNMWYLNGAYARRADAPLRDVSVPALPMILSGTESSSGSGAADTRPAPVPAPASLMAVSHHQSSPKEELEFMEISEHDLRNGETPVTPHSSVLGDYHSMMLEFLRVQESVMLAYLGDGARLTESGRAAGPVVQHVASPRPAIVQATPAPVMQPQAPAPVAAPVVMAPVMAPIAAAPVAVAPAPLSAVAAAVIPPNEIDLMSAFTAIVAEKTGYPEDALDPDQAMEADLGIDSIKRMEILGAVQKILPEAAAGAMRAEMDVVAELSTIRAIVDFITARMTSDITATTGGAATADARPFDTTGEDHTDTAVLPRFIQVPFAESAAHLTDRIPAGLRVLVTEAHDGFHTPLIAALAQAGAQPELLPRRILDDPSKDSLPHWIGALGPEGAPQALMWLDSRAAMPAMDSLTLADWRALHKAGTKRFFQVMQALAPHLREGGRIIAAMATGGLFGRALDLATPPMSAEAGVLGIVKALSLEWTTCSSKVVDLDPAEDSAAQAAHLVHELSFVKGRREVGYPAGQRTILRTEPAALFPPYGTPRPAHALPDRDWVIVATGGARGITAECLRSLAPYGPRLVLIGRTPLPPHEDPETAGLDRAALRAHFLARARENGEKLRPADIEARISRLYGARDIRRNVDDFERMGAIVDFRVADVTDADKIFDDIHARYGRIDMLIHGAGLIEDTLIENKTADSFDRVFDVKVDGAFVMTRALRRDSLRAICFFTSVAGRYGNRGQTDYAAANETLNRMAWDLRRHYGPGVAVKAINWGPWGTTTTGAGMVTEPVRQQFEQRGIGMVEAAAGRDLFFKEMFWSDSDEVESVAWNADGETMEEAVCGLPPAPGREAVGDDVILLRKARRVPGQDAVIWRFDMVNAPYVDHHRFDGVGVMPVAAVMQIMAELPRAFGITHPVVAIDDLQMYKGLTLGDGPFDLYLELEPAGPDGRRRVNIRAAGDMKRLRYRASLRFGDALPEGGLVPPAIVPDAVWAGHDIGTVYRQWLSHGPRFQTLTRIVDLDPTHVISLATGTLPADFVPVDRKIRWNFDPGLIDGLLQTVWIWARAVQNASALPLSVQSVERFSGDPLQGPLIAETVLMSAPDNPECLTDLRVYDALGRLCYRLYAFKGQASPQLNRLGGGWQGGVRPSDGDMLEAAQ